MKPDRASFRFGFWTGATFSCLACTALWLRADGAWALALLPGGLALLVGLMPFMSVWADQEDDDEGNTP
jgi:hypothetical protein